MRATLELVLLGALAGAGATAIAVILRRCRRDPVERERQRRWLVSRSGRLGDGFVTDVGEHSLYYTYTVRGVDYAASQDITAVRELLPENLENLIGPVTLKFLPDNPGNSIIVCEDWLGLRVKPRMILKEALGLEGR